MKATGRTFRRVAIVGALGATLVVASAPPPAQAFLGIDNAGQGMLTGALIGGAAGRGRGAAIGAMAGMAIGAANEAQRLRQEEEFRARQEQMFIEMEHQLALEELRIQQEIAFAREAEVLRLQQLALPPLPPVPAEVPGGDLVSDTQRSLTVLGYDPGGIDGMLGPATKVAVRAYQGDHGLLKTGQPSPELLTHMRANGG